MTNLDNSGAGSLRQAILDVNANMNGPGVVDEIVFMKGLTRAIPTDGAVDNTFNASMTITMMLQYPDPALT